MLREKCPAWGKTCNSCKEKNHFACRCPKDKPHVNLVEEDSSSEEWISCVNADGNKHVKCSMLVNGREIAFQVDTGATVNIIPASLLDQVATDLSPTVKNLRMWNDTSLTPIGTTRASVRNPANNKKYSVEFVVVEEDFMPLLGLKAVTHMQLVTLNEENLERVLSISVADRYADVFDGQLGTFETPAHLKLRENVIPVVMANKRIPIALRPKLKTELERMVELGVIAKVEEPTAWVSQIAITQKKSGELRICLDPQELNRALLREHYTLPILEDTLHELSHSRVFSKADLSSGYWHVVLDEESSLLTTFQTSFGRYRWLRLPFGLAVSSEIFQKKLIEVLDGLPGVVCIADDVLIHGENEEAHDKCLEGFLARCRNKNVKLNPKKLELRMTEITFMGHLITKDGLQTDPEKVRAIRDMQAPRSFEELRRFLGLVNYLSKFLPNVADATMPMRNLTKKGVPWLWSASQQASFEKVKTLVTNTPVLTFYNTNKELVLENDASEYGIGSVLLQEGKPVAYASRSLSDAERRYAQIEKEMLAIAFGLEKFHHYTFGRHVKVITDHKPLVSIVLKPLSKAPTRLQSLLLRTQRYDCEVAYKPGTSIPVPDTLSRAPLEDKPTTETVSVNNVSFIPIKDKRLEEIRNATSNDPDLSQLKNAIMKGWPNSKDELSEVLIPYFTYRDELTVQDGIVLRGERVIIPLSLRKEMKEKLHVGHLGINSCLRRARKLIFWPHMSTEIRQYIETCDVCARFCDRQSPEPLYMHGTPSRPWEKIGTDLFMLENRNYLVTTDYFSNFFELDYLPETTSEAVVAKMKHHFARHGIPDTVISDGGPQFKGEKFQNFSKTWGFTHETSSPGNSKANGAAEATVKIAKRLMKKCKASGEDPYIGLLNLRNTPTEGIDTSPSQRLFGRETKTQMPTTLNTLRSGTCKSADQQQKLENKRAVVVERIDKSRTSKELKPLKGGDVVRMQPIQTGKSEWKQATVAKKLKSRTYEVCTDDGSTYRRNRQFLRSTKRSRPPTKNIEHMDLPNKSTPENLVMKTPDVKDRAMDKPEPDIPTPTCPTPKPETAYTTRSGRVVKCVQRLDM